MPEPINLNLRALDRVNPGEHGESLATTVRLYQLRDVSKFSTTSLEQMLDDDRAAFGEDLVAVTEVTLFPGELLTPSLDRREGTLYLAVAALFRHPSGPAWRVTTKLPPPNPQYCHAPAGNAAAGTRTALTFTLVESRIQWL
jgi:type VI secretion system VasD/TssJ family lipoprotein